MKFLAAAVLLLVVVAAAPATAQTGRIAHFSRSGSPETLGDDADSDNFGWYQPSFHTDSARLLSAKTVLLYGQWTGSALSERQHNAKTDTLYLGKAGAMHTPAEVAALYRANYPEVKLIGFDAVGTVDKAKRPNRPKLKTKHKKAVFLTLPIGPPQGPGLLLGAVLIGLAGIGWLLGERRPAPPQAA